MKGWMSFSQVDAQLPPATRGSLTIFMVRALQWEISIFRNFENSIFCFLEKIVGSPLSRPGHPIVHDARQGRFESEPISFEGIDRNLVKNESPFRTVRQRNRPPV